jgi:hypothetical protein
MKIKRFGEFLNEGFRDLKYYEVEFSGEFFYELRNKKLKTADLPVYPVVVQLTKDEERDARKIGEIESLTPAKSSALSGW